MKPKSKKSTGADTSWHPPETAPRDGTVIIGDFGWSWASTAIWDATLEAWAIAQLTLRRSDESPDWETDTERDSSLQGWQYFPEIPQKPKSNKS
ncbi:MAG: hypothetical protein ACRC2U_00010 [Aeromonas sp.]